MVHKYYETKLEAMMLNNSTNRNEISSQTVEHNGKTDIQIYILYRSC